MQIKTFLMGGLAGALLTSFSLGVFAGLYINALVSEKIQLESQLDQLKQRQKNLKQSKEALQQELQNLRHKQAQNYDRALGTLLQASENANLTALYAIGMQAMKAKDYARAYFAFSELQHLKPDFKDIAQQLARAHESYQQEQQQAKKQALAENYAKGLDAQLAGQLATAQQYFQQVLAQNPTYRDAARRLQWVGQQLNLRQKLKETEQKKQWLERTYQLGLMAQRQGQWLQAREAYQAILKEAPGYRDTAQRLKTLPSSPPQIAALASPSFNCAERGMALAQCLNLGFSESSCNEAEMTHVLTQCKNHPDFQQALKSVGLQKNLSLLKGLPSLLNHL